MRLVRKVFSLLILVIVLMVSLDNSIDHIKIDGSIDIQRNADLANSSHISQLQHDHLWVTTSGRFAFCNKDKPTNQLLVSVIFISIDFCEFIWQPPKFI